MPLSQNIKHIFEPTSLSCGQAVIAMAIGTDINRVISLCGGTKETDLKKMKEVFNILGVAVGEKRNQISIKSQLPDFALLSLETPKCWHWSLYVKGVFYDPEHSIMTDFPQSKRRYFWELTDI